MPVYSDLFPAFPELNAAISEPFLDVVETAGRLRAQNTGYSGD